MSSTYDSNTSVEVNADIPRVDDIIYSELGSRLSGFLFKQGHSRKNWRRRWFRLYGGCLLYYKEQDKGLETVKDGIYHPQGIIPLADCNLNTTADPPHSFCIAIPGGVEYFLRAESDIHRKTWFQHIQAERDKFFKEQPKEMSDQERKLLQEHIDIELRAVKGAQESSTAQLRELIGSVKRLHESMGACTTAQDTSTAKIASVEGNLQRSLQDHGHTLKLTMDSISTMLEESQKDEKRILEMIPLLSSALDQMQMGYAPRNSVGYSSGLPAFPQAQPRQPAPAPAMNEQTPGNALAERRRWASALQHLEGIKEDRRRIHSELTKLRSFMSNSVEEVCGKVGNVVESFGATMEARAGDPQLPKRVSELEKKLLEEIKKKQVLKAAYQKLKQELDILKGSE